MNGTTANATDVENKVNPLYTSIDATNMTMSSTFNFTGTLQNGGFEMGRPLAVVTGIDGKVATTTNLYTVPAGKTAVILGAVLRITTATGLTGVMTAGIGVAAGEDDIFFATILTGFNATAKQYHFGGQGIRAEATATQVVKLGIDAAFGGTTVTIEATLFGYLK